MRDAGPKKHLLSLTFDVTIALPAKGSKTQRIVGAVEDAEVIDIGRPGGLTLSQPTEMRTLPADRVRPH